MQVRLFFLIFVANLTINPASSLLLAEPVFFKRSLQTFYQARNISLKTWFCGGIDAYTSKSLSECRFEEFKMPPVKHSVVDLVREFTREDCDSNFLYLEISAFTREDGSTSENLANQRMVYAAAEEFAARKKRVLF